ncbi:MAG: class I SAM-dependent rRNA methyltransferase [Candidatus Magasanikbacteria bacterium]|jgi:23S rRNA (cytosine1962-C5)-methyltransferase
MTKLTVLAKRIGPIRGRHPWVFSGAIKHIPDGIKSGEPIMLYDENDNFLAQGYFNSYSQIAVRLWSWDEKEKVDENFFVKRIQDAHEVRQELVENKSTNAYRVVNSENDLLPGLIVDKYDECLSVQFHNLGIAFWKEQIVSALKKVLKPKGIYERSDVGNREKEGGASTGLLFGKVPEKVEILENDYKFFVDIINGQKTGFFLDQRDKRNALQKYCKGKKVLNCFSYTGGFSVYAMGAGAKKMVSVDSSQPALDMAKENMKLNGLDLKKCEFICEDVKKYLQPELNKNEFDFDVIVLDPPAFVKDRHRINEGLQGYRKINEAAMRALPANGILVSASCSQHISMVDFRHMLSEAAGRAGRTVQILETYTHGIDHTQLAAFTEGEYLKCVFAIVR